MGFSRLIFFRTSVYTCVNRVFGGGLDSVLSFVLTWWGRTQSYCRRRVFELPREQGSSGCQCQGSQSPGHPRPLSSLVSHWEEPTYGGLHQQSTGGVVTEKDRPSLTLPLTTVRVFILTGLSLCFEVLPRVFRRTFCKIDHWWRWVRSP